MNKHGILDTQLRLETEARLIEAIIKEHDANYVGDDDILRLVAPTQLLKLPARIRDEALASFVSAAEAIAEEPDLDIEPEDNFEDLQTALEKFRELLDGDESAESQLEEAETAIVDSIKTVEAKRRISQEEPDDEEWRHWEESMAQPDHTASVSTSGLFERVSAAPLSVFSDVDE